MSRSLGNYLYTLLSFSLVLSVFSHITLSDKTKKTVALAGTVLFLSLAIAPLGELANGLYSFDVDEYIDGIKETLDTEGEYLDACEKSYCEGIRRLVCEKFSLDYSDLFVEASDFDFETMSATRVEILLKNKAVFADSRAIGEYVFRSLGVPCYVEVLFK